MNNNWWQDFFDESYVAYANYKTSEEIEESVRFIIKVLGLKKGDILFDQCCGIGDISIALARKGIFPIGVDQSEDYIIQAKRRRNDSQLDGDFYIGDALSYKTDKLCDGAVNWYTSFGYFSEDKKNKQMLQNVYDSLKPGGKFLLDYYNSDYILDNFKENIEYQIQLEDRVINMKKRTKINGSIIQSWWNYENKKEYYGESRFYSPVELQNLMREVGFEIVDVYGTIDGEKFTRQFSRCMIVGRKG